MRRLGRGFKWALLGLIGLFLAWQLWLLGWVLFWKWVDPGTTRFMEIRLAELRVKNPEAELYTELDYNDVLEKELKVMDLAAFTLARDHNLPIRVFNMNKPGALRRVIMGEPEGTLIHQASK